MTGAALHTPPPSPEPTAAYSRILMEGAGDLFGEPHLIALLKGGSPDASLPSDLAGDMERLAAGLSLDAARTFPALLEQVYGRRGGQGLALRVGRAVFTVLLKHFGRAYGLIDASFRLLPPSRRVEVGLRRLAEIFNCEFGQQVTVDLESAFWVWTVGECLNGSRESERPAAHEPSCFLMVGVLQAFLAWESGGRFYSVRETECAASGGSRCRFVIDQKPLDG